MIDDSRSARDRGAATSLSVVLLTPVFLVLGLAGFQAALWGHARTETRVLARDTATLVARAGVAPADARASVLRVLADDTDLRSVSVAVDRTPEQVMVRIEGTAPGTLRGTRAPVRVAVVVPTEGWRP
jgi:hypothetical protein